MKTLRQKLSEFKFWLKFYLIQKESKLKIFCIGFNKTGTTTLGKSFEELGYHNISYNSKIQKWYREGKFEKVLKVAKRFDTFDDIPWLNQEFIPVLDKTFPGSKFVYLERDKEDWERSLINWRKKHKKEVENINESYVKYFNHKEFVEGYFKGFPSDRFITLKINDPEGFKKLADFCDKSTNKKAFNIYNKTQ